MALFRVITRAFAVAALLLPLAERAAIVPRQFCELPAGEAPTTLRVFSDRFGTEVLFATEVVRGVHTQAVRGDFTAREALDRMLAGTDLVAVADERSGALAISLRRKSPLENSQAQKRELASGAALSGADRFVQLEEFKVSTTLGTYGETTTSAGSKTPMNMRDLPATVQVLNSAFIEDKRAQSLEDLYPYVVGMTRESTAALGFTLRGFSNNLTNTLLNNVQTDGLPGLASRFGSPTTANVERVEVIKGPISVLYGSMNPGGIINVVTKQPLARSSRNFYATLASFAGQNSGLGDNVSFTATLDTTGPLDAGKHWLYRLIAAYEDESGFRQFSWAKNYHLFPSLTYRLDQNTEVTVKVEIIQQHRFSDQYLVAPFRLIQNVARYDVTYQDRRNTEYDRGDIYAVLFKHRFENRWTLKANLRDVQHVDGRDPLENRSITNATPVADSLVIQRYRDTWNRRRYTYYDVNFYGEVGPEWFQHTLLLGHNGGYETHDFMRWIFATLPGGVSVYDPVHDTRPFPYVVYDPAVGPSQNAISKYYNFGYYVSDQIKLGKNLRASAGLHFETYDMTYLDTAPVTNSRFALTSRSTVPSVGLVYQPHEWLSLYASYTESFKPSPPQNVDENNHGFSPEIAKQVEVGAKTEFLAGRLGVLLSLYDLRRQNVSETVPLAFLPNNVQIYRLIGRQQSQGVELSINCQPLPHFQLQIGYTYDDARTTASVDPALINAKVANAPRQSANFWARYNFPEGSWRGFGVGFGLIYVGSRNGLLPATPKATDTFPYLSLRTMPIPSNTRADVACYYRWRRYDFAINVTNVTDLRYIASADSEIDVVPGAPRKISASLHYIF